MQGSILSHTRAVAAGLADRFAHDPEGELEVWVMTAQQREAMVVKLYDADAIEHRLPKLSDEPEVLRVVRKAIGGIWAQERSHTRLVGSLRVLDENRLTILRSVYGDVQGRFAHHATADGWISTITTPLVGVVRAVGIAPEFTRSFRALAPRDFFKFSHELETTAKEGYGRILELLAALDEANATGSTSTDASLKFGITGPYEFAKTLAEECFHAAVFEQLERWLEPDGLAFVDIPPHDAVQQLRALALAHLSVTSPHLALQTRAALSTPWTKSIRDDRLVSDGGLGGLFKEYGLPLPAVAAVRVESS